MENVNVENLKDKTIVLNVFKKTREYTEPTKDGKTKTYEIENYFGTKVNEKRTVTIRLSNDVKDRLALMEGVKFPVELTIRESQAFLVDEEYEDKNGITMKNTILVITDFDSARNAVLTKRSIDAFLSGEEE